MAKKYCKGEHCPVKNACRRYTEGNDLAAIYGTYGEGWFMNHCTNQKLFIKND